MGMLIDGRWTDEDQTIQNGSYIRSTSAFAKPVEAQTLRAMEAEPGRFHLVASLSCPWSHRSTLTRAVKCLDHIIPVHIARGPRTKGYRLGTLERPWKVPGADVEIEHLHELYRLSDPTYTGRATVALLWDAEQRVIVSNESAHILRGLDAVAAAGCQDWTLRPDSLASEIDETSDLIHRTLNNGVYRAGKARRQDVYDGAVEEVFETLDQLDARLSKLRFMHGPVLTESDLRLWPTLARFDAVYHGHFKCGRKRLTDYKHLWAYARDVMAWPGVRATFDEPAIRAAYYGEDRDLNPFGIVATAPTVDWGAPHQRDILGERSVCLRSGDVVPVK